MNYYYTLLQDPAPAAPEQPAGGNPGGFLVQLFPFLIIFALFWFLILRPQRRQQKEREAMLQAIKKNDHVLTSGGILGIVDKVKEGEVILKIDEKNDVRIRVARHAIVDIKKVSGAADEEKKGEGTEETEKK